jgi:uncharacterized protein YndB with AHSA1/START domain
MAETETDSGAATVAADEGLLLTRTFDAPARLVFRAWTEPDHFARWFGPAGSTVPVCRIDPRPGGVIHFCMRAPEEAVRSGCLARREVWTKGVFREVREPSLLAFTFHFSDLDGRFVAPARYGLPPDHPTETRVTVTLAERGGRTTLTLRQDLPRSVQELGAREGWVQGLDRLAEHLASVLEG